jgi:alpha-aminoadipate carrier protein LysW
MNLTNTDVDEEEIDEEEVDEGEEDEEASDDAEAASDDAEAAADVTCPECEAEIDEEIERGDLITCPECGRRLEVLDIDPAHLTLFVPENEKQQSDVSGRVVGERRPITNEDDGKYPVVGTALARRSGKIVRDPVHSAFSGGVTPEILIRTVPPEPELLQSSLVSRKAKVSPPTTGSVVAFLNSHSADAIADASKKEDEIFQSGDSHKILRVIDTIVRNIFRKQQLISKVRNVNDYITRILKQVIDEVESGKRFTSNEMRTRLAEDIQVIYDASPARAKALARREAEDERTVDNGPFAMLPEPRRRPGGRSGGTYGNDPDARELLDVYEQLAAQAIAAVASNRGEKEVSLNISTMGEGPQRGDPEKADDAEPTDRSLAIALTWENWWDLINADWTVRLRQPSPLSRTLQKFVRAEMDRLEEKAWQAESILIESDPKRKTGLAKKYGVSARIDKLEKRGPTGKVILRGAEAAGQRGRNKELAARLGISVDQVENMWREVKALKRFPASKVLERVKRPKYF